MDSQTHTAINRQTQHTRNAAARARRATLSQRLQDVAVIDATLDGEAVLVAVSRIDPHRAAVLYRVDGRWTCGCFAATYSAARTCAHLRAAAARPAPENRAATGPFAPGRSVTENSAETEKGEHR